jgi:IS1 family transposase
LNRLSAGERAKILACLVEGNGVRGTARLCDRSTQTVTKLVRELGPLCYMAHDAMVNDLFVPHMQADEITTYVGQRKPSPEKARAGQGYFYTWIAIDPKSKLIVDWWTGRRSAVDAERFLSLVKGRVRGTTQICTDAYAAYQGQIAEVFGTKARHSVMRKGDVKHHGGERVHTSFIERMNKTIRQTNKRFSRRPEGFSKNLFMHRAALSIQLFHYNFGRLHGSLRVTPAMEMGLTDRVWSLEEIVEICPQGLCPEKRGSVSSSIAKILPLHPEYEIAQAA